MLQHQDLHIVWDAELKPHPASVWSHTHEGVTSLIYHELELPSYTYTRLAWTFIISILWSLMNTKCRYSLLFHIQLGCYWSSRSHSKWPVDYWLILSFISTYYFKAKANLNSSYLYAMPSSITSWSRSHPCIFIHYLLSNYYPPTYLILYQPYTHHRYSKLDDRDEQGGLKSL